MKKKRREYKAPVISVVKLNPAQAVLSACSTTGSNQSLAGAGSKCKTGNCMKKFNSGDSLGQS